MNRNTYPLTGNIGTVRTKRKTLGEGSYGRVNFEEFEEGNVATKYFTSDETICENTAEIAGLKYLKGLPNVAQLIRIESRPVGLPIDYIVPSIAEDMSFPAVIMGKAVGSLNENDLVTSWEKAYDIMIQVLRGYYTLHQSGIVHRDTKPGNMLLTSTGEVWISDFGMARYLDNSFPPIQDAYTGTAYFSSPEVLMKSIMKDYSPIDWYKSDSWAVGVSLYTILVQDYYLFNGKNKTDILHDIFRIKGTPTLKNGGDSFETFIEYRAKTGFDKTFSEDPDGVRRRLIGRMKFKPDDEDILKAVVETIVGLTEYDPEKRLSIEKALKRASMSVSLPYVPHRKIITPQYMNFKPLPSDINPFTLDILFDWLQDAMYINEFSVESYPVILDRTGVYTMAFLQAYSDHPFVKKSNLQLIGTVALFLAGCFFNSSRYHPMNVNSIGASMAWKHKKEEIMECIKMYMTGNIDFYGRTFYDDILDFLPRPASKQKQIIMRETVGYLNYACFQKYLFPAETFGLNALQNVFVYFINNPSGISQQLYLSRKTKVGLKDDTTVKMKAFLKKVSDDLKTKRARGGTRRVRKAKRNTRRNFRNGFGR